MLTPIANFSSSSVTDDVKESFITFDSQGAPKYPGLLKASFKLPCEAGWHMEPVAAAVCAGPAVASRWEWREAGSASLSTEGRQLVRFWESRVLIGPFFVCHVSAPWKMCI